MTTEHIITIDDDGLQFIYSDDLLDLLAEGDAVVTRASDVEPAQDGSGWQADMAKSGGPVLAGFKRRADALAAEVQWINQHVLGAC